MTRAASTRPVAADQAETPTAPPRRAWDDAPLRHKVTLIAAVGGVWGVAIGQGVEHLGLPWWLGPAGAIALSVLLVRLGSAWITQPVEALVESLERIAKPDRPIGTDSLPRRRGDEVGRAARAVHRIAVGAIRDHHEANRLRRTIDQRIERATQRATSELSKMAKRDPLTALGNRRFLDEHLEELTRTCAAAGTELICVIIDLDNFKPVNDKLGHTAGDELITFAATLIRGSIREDDLAVRYGGDEFVIIMPGADLSRAKSFVDRVRSLFADHVHHTLPDTVDPGLSAGVASLIGDCLRSGEDLIDLADKRLYHAKDAGKGRTGT